MNFNNLGLSKPILTAVHEKGYSTPTPIQEKTIPVIKSGGDLMASAQTGTGKTAGFTLPILERLTSGKKVGANRIRVLILTPTRELAAQVHESVRDYGKHTAISSAVVFGGVKINPQMKELRQGVDILVATPGRLLDLHSQNALKFTDVETLVLDEADRMLDMGFIHDIRKIQSLMPKKKQVLLFSATFSSDIRQLAKTMLYKPEEIDVAPKNTTADNINQIVHPVDKKNKTNLLRHLIVTGKWSQVLVFTRTKHGANKLVKQLYKAGILAAAIHGNKSQSQRTRALSEFKQGKVDILIATDIAARGLDIVQLPHVVNYDLPNVPEDYVHRIGRTGRAGNQGEAVSLVCADEIDQLSAIERLLKRNLIRLEIESFEPEHSVPESRQARSAGSRSAGSRSGKIKKSANSPSRQNVHKFKRSSKSAAKSKKRSSKQSGSTRRISGNRS